MSDVELQSALLLVPAAEAAVGAHRARLDANARDGVPAHFTVPYPFLPPAEIGPGVLADLAALSAGAPRFSFILDRVRWFGESVVWLGPSDESPFRALTELATEVTLMAEPKPERPPGSPDRWHRRRLLPARVAGKDAGSRSAHDKRTGSDHEAGP